MLGARACAGNYLDGIAGRGGGVSYGKHHGFCLETQKFPDAINQPGNFASPVLRPREIYQHLTVHTFGTTA